MFGGLEQLVMTGEARSLVEGVVLAAVGTFGGVSVSDDFVCV